MPSSVINSDDGVISGTSGIKTTGGDDGVLKIQNNGTDAVTVASDGDVTLAADLSVTSNLLFNSGYGSVATAYGCRAWVNFNGTGTVAIRASGNVSSITDGGTGIYTINLANAMPDTNYSTVASTTVHAGVQDFVSVQISGSTYSTTAIGLRTYSSSNIFDPSYVGVTVLR
jgi:hypothetical protein